MSFPIDRYTPHGYLATPNHTRNLSPLGVLRSHDAGFRWHHPAHGGSYGGRETYRAGFRISVDGALHLAQFDQAFSPYHSKDLFEFELERGKAHAGLLFHAVGDHALRGLLTVRGVERVAVCAEYTRLLSAGGQWGESGLVGRVAEGCLVLQGFEDGDAFVLWVSQPPDDLGITAVEDEAASWAAHGARGLPASGYMPVTGRRGEEVRLHGVVGFGGLPGGQLDAILARGTTLREAMEHLERARLDSGSDRARKLESDTAFWVGAPQLEGDWPEHWRRGMVYDLETVRMMVKEPLGIYRRPWDAMQIQAPRVVLAETAIDALLLSYADVAAAQNLLFGTFLDAPESNVPCSREDGSYNMVAADGTVCGTGPQWGYPWLALRWLDALRPSRAWLDEIYPRLTAYMDWWLANRSSPEGWLGFACSWESGQDESPRFGEQPLGGGQPVRHVRPVDLHAAMAHAAQAMAGFATRLGRLEDVARWVELAVDFTNRTEQLWNGARYADYDEQAGSLTGVDDIMLLAPVALGVASPERVAALRGKIASINADSLAWPMEAWTAIEAASAAGMYDKACELSTAICERVYTFWDSREAGEGKTLPGISCEYWPVSGRCGGEGYGWGAFGTHIVLHTLLGFAPSREGLAIRPNLPLAWRVPGRRYSARFTCRGSPVHIVIEPLNARVTSISINGEYSEIEWGEAVKIGWGTLEDSE